MRKYTIGGVAVIAASILWIAALPQDPASGRIAREYGDRLEPLIGKRFDFPKGIEDTFALQATGGHYTLVAVGADYAQFATKSSQMLVPLSCLRVFIQ